MAIINSVVMGSAKKKVGEVTIATLHGRTVARKYQPSVSNPRTAGQVDQRNRVANNVLAFRALAALALVGFPLKRNYQSGYNAFTKANVNQMPFDQKYADFAALRGGFMNDGTTLVVSKGSLQVGNVARVQASGIVTLLLNPLETRIAAGDVMYAYGIEDTGAVYITQTTITSTMIGAGSVTAAVAPTVVLDVYGAFIVSKQRKDCSSSSVTFS